MVTTAAPYQAFEAGDTVNLNFQAEYYGMNAENIAKGKLLIKDAANNLKIAPTTPVVGSQYFVSIEAKDNSAGSANDISIGVAKQNDIVGLQTKAILKPGDPVKSSTGTAGMVMGFVEATDDEGLKVGYYVGKEAATFARDASTPFGETLNGSRILPSDAAVDDIVAIRLK